MTIKHICGNKTVSNNATPKKIPRSSYNEHAAMHYEGGGWSHWTETVYIVEKCENCGHAHTLKENELL